MRQIKGRIHSDKKLLFGILIVTIAIIIAIFAPKIIPNSPTKVNMSGALTPPSPEYIMGTDHMGRCIFSRLIYGTRISMGASVIILVSVFTIGTLIGVIAGYVGGFVDSFIMKIINILFAFPGIVLALAIAGILGPSLINTVIAIVSVAWVKYARIVRGMVLSIKNKEYVIGARACGTSNYNIIIRYILPNIISPLVVLATLDVGSMILRISALSFLGLGAQPPTPEWGAMLNDGKSYMDVAPWTMIFPGFAIMILVMAFNFIGDSLRDFLDPQKSYKGDRV